jgi:hypothetical protein
LSHGSAALAAGAASIVDYAAEYPHEEPNCCPPYYKRSIVRHLGTGFAAFPDGQVTQAPEGDF